MTDNEYTRSEKYFYRIVGLSPKETNDWKNKFSENLIEVTKRKNHEDFVLSFQLIDDKVCMELCNYIDTFKSYDSRGIWVELTTENDMDGIRLPEYVLNVYSKLGGNIDFSVIFIEEDEVGEKPEALL